MTYQILNEPSKYNPRLKWQLAVFVEGQKVSSEYFYTEKQASMALEIAKWKDHERTEYLR